MCDALATTESDDACSALSSANSIAPCRAYTNACWCTRPHCQVSMSLSTAVPGVTVHVKTQLTTHQSDMCKLDWVKASCRV